MREYTLQDICNITGKSYQSVHALFKKSKDVINPYTKEETGRTIWVDEAGAKFFLYYYKLDASVLDSYLPPEREAENKPVTPRKPHSTAVQNSDKDELQAAEEPLKQALKRDTEASSARPESSDSAAAKQTLINMFDAMHSKIVAQSTELLSLNTEVEHLSAKLEDAQQKKEWLIDALTDEVDALNAEQQRLYRVIAKREEEVREERAELKTQIAQLLLLLQEEKQEKAKIQLLLPAPKKSLMERIKDVFSGKKEKPQQTPPPQPEAKPVEDPQPTVKPEPQPTKPKAAESKLPPLSESEQMKIQTVLMGKYENTADFLRRWNTACFPEKEPYLTARIEIQKAASVEAAVRSIRTKLGINVSISTDEDDELVRYVR